MPVPKSHSAQRKLIKGVMARRPHKFKKGSKARLAREALARKIQAQGKDKSSSYAIATAVIKRGGK